MAVRHAAWAAVQRVDPLLATGTQFARRSGVRGWTSTSCAFRATHLLELGVSHADVAIQLWHTDGGARAMSTYGHPSEDGARERLKRAYERTVTPLRVAQDGSETRRKAV